MLFVSPITFTLIGFDLGLKEKLKFLLQVYKKTVNVKYEKRKAKNKSSKWNDDMPYEWTDPSLEALSLSPNCKCIVQSFIQFSPVFTLLSVVFKLFISTWTSSTFKRPLRQLQSRFLRAFQVCYANEHVQTLAPSKSLK